MWELATLSIPYSGKSKFQILISVVAGDRLPIPKDCPSTFAHLIQWCWDQDIKKRPSCLDILGYIEQSVQCPSPIPSTTDRKYDVLENKGTLPQVPKVDETVFFLFFLFFVFIFYFCLFVSEFLLPFC
jgi:hypothetical protein